MPKLTTFKAIKKALLYWDTKIDKVPIYYRWNSDKKINATTFILIGYKKKEWTVNYITPEQVFYATIDDVTGHCSTYKTSLVNDIN